MPCKGAWEALVQPLFLCWGALVVKNIRFGCAAVPITSSSFQISRRASTFVHRARPNISIAPPRGPLLQVAQSSTTKTSQHLAVCNKPHIARRHGAFRSSRGACCDQLHNGRHKQRCRSASRPSTQRQHIRSPVLANQRLPRGRKLGQEGLHLRSQRQRCNGKVDV